MSGLLFWIGGLLFCFMACDFSSFFFSGKMGRSYGKGLGTAWGLWCF